MKIFILLLMLCSSTAFAAVDKIEAEKIGREYFGNDCGAVEISDAGNQWRTEGFAGYAAKPQGYVLIDKETGKISRKWRQKLSRFF